MKKGKIVLFAPKAGVGFQAGLPLALLAISRYLASDEHFEIKIISAIIHKNYLERILSESDGALCLGISCFTGYPVKEALEVAKAAKQRYPELPVIFGGWHPSILSAETLSNPYVDIVAAGQGERSFTALAKAIFYKTSLKDIQGIYYKDERGEVIFTGESELEDINNFPPVPYHLLEADKFIFKTFYAAKTIDYYSSIGCPHKCAFCVEPQMNKGRWFGLSAERVVDEWQELNSRYGINGINLLDTNFCASEKRVRDIARMLLEKNLRFGWGPANGRIDRLLNYSEQTWKLMKASGCASLLVGAESALDKGLEIVDKRIKVKDTIELVKICNHYGIGLGMSFMIGLPSDDKNFIEQEYKSALKLFNKVYSKLKCLHLFLYAPYPGSRLYEEAQMRGFKPPKDLKGWSDFELQTVRTPWVPEKYRHRVEFLQDYILKFMDGSFRDIFNNRKNVFLRWALKFFYPFLYFFALLRWKLKFFYLPIELKLLKWARGFF